MNIKTIMALACAAALCGGVRAAEESEKEEESSGWSWAMGEGISFNETPIVSAELSISWDS